MAREARGTRLTPSWRRHLGCRLVADPGASVQRSAFRYPLDEIFGSVAHVRLLRVLVHDVEMPLGVADAARLAGLTPAGARKALERLGQSGLIERVGSGRAQKWGLKKNQAIIQALHHLFVEEHRRYEELVTGLQGAVALSEILSAWIERLPLGMAEPVNVSVVADGNAITWIQEELRARLIELEKEFNLIIEVAVFTRADTPTPGSDAVVLWGADVSHQSVARRRTQTHSEAEQRSLLMAEGIAELIRSDPSLIKRAVQHLNRLLREDQGTASGDIAEWRQLLEAYSPDRVRDLLVSASSRAQRLRQSSPFFAVLTPSERDRVMAGAERRP